ncbi:MAG: MotA/TolQ/ExbB proton channel family protein [Myxococcales bacterium]|nr:MotA/TolQ/ExbB proton channel family protein [Myxococcales bacterium]
MIVDLILLGGWFLLPIAIASILGVALVVERLLYLRRDNIMPPDLRAKAPALIRQGDRAALRELFRGDNPLARVLARGLERPRATAGEMREAMEDTGRRELYLMKRYTGALASLANISPLLGLLGTVVGMISMFQGVVATAASNRGAADVGTLADGIWQALLTTAAGLMVAIPLYLAHRYLLGRIDGLISEIEDHGRDLISRFASDLEDDDAVGQEVA